MSYHNSKTKFSYIKFVKVGARLPKTSKKTIGFLHSAPDWVLLPNLESTLAIPPAIAISKFRSDTCL